MSNLTNVGTPTGIVGIPNPTQRYTRWAKHEVYGLGNDQTNRYIVNVGDTVLDVRERMEYLVVAVSDDGIPTLEPLILNRATGLRVEDTVLGTGPGLCSEGYRIYVNSKLIPSPFQIDTRVMINGSENAYIKLFRGHNTSNSGEVLSGVFNSAKRMTTENIPLEALTIPHRTNTTYKKPTGGWITEAVSDGEVITCVVYTNSGIPSASFRLLVVDTEFMRNIDESKKHITDITLISPYISETDSRLLELPIGMVTQSSSFMGKVTYNDGSFTTYPVDGTKFSLHGLQNYVASRLNDVSPVILNYRLSSTEFANGIQVVGDHKFINRNYRVKTVESNNRYNVKLYPLLRYNHTTNKWELNWWLYNLNRDAPVEVTNFIEYAANKTFNGSRYGEAQAITVVLNLERLGTSYAYFRHVEHFTITLARPINTIPVTSYYLIQFDGNSGVGEKTMVDVTGKNGNYTINISNGFPNVQAMIQSWYYGGEPLIYPYNEVIAPRPNRVRISKGNWSKEINIEDLMKPITGVNVAIATGDCFELEFLRTDSNSRFHLGRVGLIAQLTR